MTEALPLPPSNLINTAQSCIGEADSRESGAAPDSANEVERLEALQRYDILDTPPETAFDRITSLAARLFDLPIALVSLMDESREWFKSVYGLDLREVQRETSISTLTLSSNQVLVIPDTRQDSRLASNPLVQSDPGLRFYAGAPLVTQDGFNLGTLCLLDTKPRHDLSEAQKATLADLAAVVMDELELRLAVRKVAQVDAALLEVTQGISTVVGDAFFLALVQHLAKALGVDYAYIGLVSGKDREAIKTIATCVEGQIVSNFEYLLRDTPCLEVLQQRKLCCYPDRVQLLFPQAPLLEPLKVESYGAIPFFDSRGIPLGVLGVMDSKPLTNVQLTESLLTIFAVQIATEIERQQIEVARQQAQRNLESLVQQRTVELSQVNYNLHLEIAERQQAEAALQKEQELLKVLLDNVQVGIVACNAEGILTLFNRAAREFHGLPVQALPPDQWAQHYDLFLPDGKTHMAQDEIPLFQALRGKTVNSIEMVIAPKQGPTKTLLASGQAIVDGQGKQHGAVVVMHDITERKQAEAERAQLMRQQVQEQTARLEAEAGQQRSAFLVEVSTVLSTSLDYERTLASVADLVVPFFADWCAIDLLQDQGVIHRVAVAHRDPAKVELGWELHRQYPKSMDAAEGVPRVLRTGQPEIRAEILEAVLVTAAQDAKHLQILRELGLKAYIIAPLIARGKILGAVSFVTSESGRRYREGDLALAEDIAHRSAIAIDNARLYQEAQYAQQAAERFAQRTNVLQRITAALSQALTPQQVAEVVMNQGIAALGTSAGSIVLLTDQGTSLKILQAIGYPEFLVTPWASFSVNAPVPLAEMVRTGEPLFLETGAALLAKYPQLADAVILDKTRAMACIPLAVEGRLIGGMGLSFVEPQAFHQEDQAFMLTLAQQCAQAIARSHLYEAERTARDAAEAANRVKDEFLAVLSHELRTPLNPILGWSNLLRHGKLNATQTTHALETIERNAKLQTQLIEDLLDVSRILQGKLTLNIVPVNLVSTIQSALETVRLAAEAKSIQIQTSFDLTVGPVLGDATRLQQIMWNLLTNAIKFNPAGGQVEVRLGHDGLQAQIQVLDRGKGISPDFLPHLFEYFRQADSTTTRQFGGLGLGLAIVHHLVELHGGTVEADSPGDNQGATFTVRLPLMQEGTDLENGLSLNAGTDIAAPLWLATLQILVVDDDPDTRDYFSFVLEQAGATVTSVASAEQALQVLEDSIPDVLLSDVGMPGMDGYALMRQIRSLPAHQGGQLLAIALTAYAGEIDYQRVIAAGFQRHLPKPVEPEVLVQAIADLTRPPE